MTVVPNRLSAWTTPGVPGEFSVMLGRREGQRRFADPDDLDASGVDHRAEVLPGYADGQGAVVAVGHGRAELVTGLDGAGHAFGGLGEHVAG